MGVQNFSKSLLALTIAATLFGCSGGGTDSETPETEVKTETESELESKKVETPLEVQGSAIDGYLTNSIVCLDLNKNGYCDLDSEPATSTDSNGKYNLDVSAYKTHANFTTAPILVFDGYDSDTGKRFAGKLFAPQDANFTNNGTAKNLSVNVTAITTLVAKLVEIGESIDNAKKQVKTALNIPDNIDVSADPIELIKNNTAGAADFIGKNISLNRSISTLVAAASQDTNLSDKNDSQITDIVFKALAATIKSQQTTTTTTTTQPKDVETLFTNMAKDPEAKKQLNSTVLEKASTVAAITAKKTTEIYANTTITSLAEAQAAAVNATKVETAASSLVKSNGTASTIKLDDTFDAVTVQAQVETETTKVKQITVNELALEFLTLAGITLSEIEKNVLAGLADLSKQSPFTLEGLKTYISSTANYESSSALKSVVNKITQVLGIQKINPLPETAAVVPGRDILTRAVANTTNAAAIAKNCPANGGIQLDVGIDINADGKLQDSEVDPTRTQYICHGANGKDGATGATGAKGADGLSAYQVWLAAGNAGTEADFLASLKGANGTGGTTSTGTILTTSSSIAKGQNNCAQGGVLLNLGQDTNTDGILDATEVQSTSPMCYPNLKPDLKTVSSLSPVVSSQYQFIAEGFDIDNNQFTFNVITKPTWLTVSNSDAQAVTLSGTVPATVGVTEQIEIQVSDGESTFNKIWDITSVDGVAVTVTGATVQEGALGDVTPASFSVALSKPLDADITLNYIVTSQSLMKGLDYQFLNVNPQTDTFTQNQQVSLVIPAGTTSATIDLNILGDNQYTPDQVLWLDPNGFDYTGVQTVYMESFADLVVQNDDTIQLNVGQYNEVVLTYDQPNKHTNSAIANLNASLPNGMTIQAKNYGNACGNNGGTAVNPVTLEPLNCASSTNPWAPNINNAGVLLVGTPSTALEGISQALVGTINVQIVDYFYGGNPIQNQSFPIDTSINFITDSDLDGVVDANDAFPSNPLARTDSDLDGIGDEWEMQQFGNLTDANATSNYTGKDYTDLEAFQAQLLAMALKPIDFENGVPANVVTAGSTSPWLIDTTQGSNSATSYQSPLISDNYSSEAILSATIDVVGGMITYDSLVSPTQYTYSSSTLIDGQYVSPSSWMLLANGWERTSINVADGIHTLEIRFSYMSTAGHINIDNIGSQFEFSSIRPIDLDGDGILNSVDLWPNNPNGATDTDADGLADEWEMQYWNTLTLANETTDNDGDGLLDIDEFGLGTSPNNSDTDGDGALDGSDIAPNNGQYREDTDSDGIADEWETATFGDLITADATTDYDGDGVLDIDEFKNGTPAALDSDGDGVADLVDPFPNNATYAQDSNANGLPDEWEQTYGYVGMFSPLGDSDMDGYTNLQEFQNGTDPTVADFNAKLDYIEVIAGQSTNIDVLANDSLGNASAPTVSSVTQPTVGSLTVNADNTLTYTSAATDGGNQMVEVTVTDGNLTITSPLIIHLLNANTPTMVEVSTGTAHSLMLMSDGSVYGWGNNTEGQLGDGTTTNQTIPVPANISNVSAVFATVDSSFVTLNDGTAWVLGTTNKQLMMPDGVSPLMNLQKIVGSISRNYYLPNSALALDSQGNVYRLVYDVLPGTTPLVNIVSVVTDSDGLTPLTGIVDIAEGYYEFNYPRSIHSLALRSTGEIIAWGSNNVGQLGNGTNTSSTTPVVVSKLTNIVQIAAVGQNSYAVDDLGDVYAWGSMDGIGDGNGINRNVPVKVPNVANVSALNVGKSQYGSEISVYAQTSTNDYIWGESSNNNLLDYSYAYSTPKLITAYKPTTFSMGQGFSVFTENNTLYSIGLNNQGQLGDGSTVSSSTPVKVVLSSDSVISGAQGENFEWSIIPPRWASSSWLTTQDTAVVQEGLTSVEVTDALTDNQSATLEANVFTAAGDVTFQYKVSSELDFDTLTFSVDGAVQATYSGEVPWTLSTNFPVTAGQHKLTWTYSKDGGTSVGQDKAWIDDIQFPLDSDKDGVSDLLDAAPYDAQVQ